MNDELANDLRFVKARATIFEAGRFASRHFANPGELAAAPCLRADSLALIAKAEAFGR